jgi:hypothetical protein
MPYDWAAHMYSRFGKVDASSEQKKRSKVVAAPVAGWMKPISPFS